ncbi:MAG: hypothetical protein WCF03_04445 [Nitrososphaeraceae archaeon]
MYLWILTEPVGEWIPIYLSDAPVHVDPTWHALPLLHRCSAGMPTRPHQVTSRFGPPHTVADTLPSPYGRTPPAAGCRSP